jgi:predicted dehydrogenase
MRLVEIRLFLSAAGGRQMMRFSVVLWHVLVFSLSVSNSARAEEAVLRVGIVGCDTSHVIAFTNLINDPKATGAMAKVQVTVAYPGGSPDIANSRDRLAGYVQQLRERGVTIVDSIEQLAEQSDAILLESLDGRVHLKQFRAVARGKPVFIDKPAAASLADLLAIFRHADKTNTPCFSASALRFCDEVQARHAYRSDAPGPVLVRRARRRVAVHHPRHRLRKCYSPRH